MPDALLWLAATITAAIVIGTPVVLLRRMRDPEEWRIVQRWSAMCRDKGAPIGPLIVVGEVRNGQRRIRITEQPAPHYGTWWHSNAWHNAVEWRDEPR